MKQIIINVEDSAFDYVYGMLQLCNKVELVSCGRTEGMNAAGQTDQCVSEAIRELKERKAIRHPCDYAYVMRVMNEEVVKGLPFFYSPMEFIDYLKMLGIENLPGKSALYDTLRNIEGRFPEWTFRDHPTETKKLWRKNVANQFLSAFGRAKRK